MLHREQGCEGLPLAVENSSETAEGSRRASDCQGPAIGTPTSIDQTRDQL